MIKFWGVRGSLPAPAAPADIATRVRQALEGFFDAGYDAREHIDTYLASLPVERLGGFGGNTVSCEIFTDAASVIVDGGSGIRRKGYELMAGPCGTGTGEIHILMTHLHWDHVIGLPFFVPLFMDGNTINIYSVQPETEETMRTLFRKPNFPVAYDALPSTIVYHRLEPRTSHTIGDITFTPYRLDHPDPCWGYRFEHGGRALAYCVDTECTRATADTMGADRPLYRNAHTMIFDAQYTLYEAIEKVNWGHAAATLGLDVALREKIGKVVFMHHDPAAADEDIARAIRQTEDYLHYARKGIRTADGKAVHVDWLFAREGMIVPV
jgi:phosphoribosyl 1,2-cyclic phosphodiesterase